MNNAHQTSPHGSVLTPGGWAKGRLVTAGERIVRIDAVPTRAPSDPGLPLIIPGFIDLHVHGAEGVDFSGAKTPSASSSGTTPGVGPWPWRRRPRPHRSR